MKYYKLINDNTLIGVIHSGAFVKESANGARLFYSAEVRGEFVDYNGLLYRDYWMVPTQSSRNYTLVNIIEITEEEYNILKPAIDNGEDIPIDDDDEEEPIVIPPDDAETDIVLEYLRVSKKKEMSNMCRKAIENGFDIELFDGETHHFSLTTQDQLNLMALTAMIETQDIIPYHADNEAQKFYSAAEIKLIINGANNHKNYHITYYNALKAYINSLDNIEDIAAVTYGIPIPEAFQNEVWQVIGK